MAKALARNLLPHRDKKLHPPIRACQRALVIRSRSLLAVEGSERDVRMPHVLCEAKIAGLACASLFETAGGSKLPRDYDLKSDKVLNDLRVPVIGRPYIQHREGSFVHQRLGVAVNRHVHGLEVFLARVTRLNQNMPTLLG